MDMNQPIFPAPDGYVVDLANPQRTGVEASFWIGVVGMVVAAGFMGVRFYTKLVLAKNFSADDATLIVAWLLSMAVQITMLFQYGRGTLGVHIWELTGHRVNSALNLVTVVSAMYAPFMASAKLSLLFFYLRLSPIRWFRINVYISMFVVVGYNIGVMFPLLFACTPIKKTWDLTVVGGHCIDRTPVYIATAVLNMVTDIWLLVLPIPMIIKLQMSRGKKVALILTFAVGSATCITSGVRLILLFPMLKTIDQTWAVVMPAIWIFVEANLVVITGCLPTMRLFIRHVAPGWLGDSSSQNSRSRSKRSKYAENSTENSELKTIGSKTMNKRLYSVMDEETMTVGSEDGVHAGWQDDKDSERGIVPHRPVPEITITQEVVIESTPTDGYNKRDSWKDEF